MKKVLLILLTVFLFIICLPVIASASPLAFTTERLSGQDRIDTALKISQKGWTSAQTVILCESSDFPDSIASTPYAAQLNAPILLTGGDSLDPRVTQELNRLHPQNVILLGGSGCLKPSLEQNLKQLSLNYERIGGANRYETSVLLAERLSSDSLIVANGDNFPDALSAASYAGIKQIPIVLTSTTLPNPVLTYLQTKAPQHITVIGGEAVVPSQELTGHNFSIETRLGGKDRFETNYQVVSTMKTAFNSNDLFLASGLNFPDAIAGAVLASKEQAPLLLTDQNDIPPSIYGFMRSHMVVEPPVAASSPPAAGASSKQGVINAASGLNLRDTPSSSGKVLLTVPTGTTLTLTSYQNNWYQTTYQGKTGWLSEQFLTVTAAPQPPAPKTGTVNTSSGLNMRDTPSSTGKILATIPNGTTLSLSNLQNDWYQTTYQSKTGWVSDAYISMGTAAIDLSPNGKVYILGGTGVISTNSEAIINGKASSAYPDNLKDFPPLPSKLTPPSSGDGDSSTTPSNYDPSKEIPIDPFAGMPANCLAGKKIMLDPGHGSPDTGAIGPNNTYEKDNNLATALDLKAILEQAGATVLMTRSGDSSPAANYTEVDDLQARVAEAEGSKPDLFISLHNDSASNSAVQGTSAYYSSDNPQAQASMYLASCIESAVTDTVKTNNRGVKEAAFYVVRYTTMPATLVETAFISNPYEEARLQNETFRKNLAAAIFHGIYTYYTTPIPKS